MSGIKEYLEFIPKNETPTVMPKGISVKYYVCWPDEPKEINLDNFFLLPKLGFDKNKHIIHA